MEWPDDAPRGAVTTFCLEQEISRKTFYELRRRVALEGPAAVLEPRSRRPRRSPTSMTGEVKQQALAVRAALERSGLDHGPVSVHDKMRALGMESVPSIASLARIFRRAGVARLQPNKKPRAAYRRFVFPSPDACWQLDATEYVLTGGRKCVIFQLIDDHSRYSVASLVAGGETAEAAVAVVRKGIAAHGVPQRLLTDNGVALNPIRRGMLGQLVIYVAGLGVEAITGKPYRPTTQGKNERFHQTLFRWLDKQPLADTIDQLQEQVDAFDVVYNTQRPHQGLPGRITPQQAWDAIPKATPPRPHPGATPALTPPRPRPSTTPTSSTPLVTEPHAVRVGENGAVRVRGIKFQVGTRLAGTHVNALENPLTVLFTDAAGTVLIEHAWPPPGVKYVGSGRRRGTPPHPPVSPMS